MNAKYKVTKLPLLVVIDGDTGKVKIEDALEFYEEELVEKQKKAITKVTIKKWKKKIYKTILNESQTTWFI